MSEVRIVGNGGTPGRRKITERGSGESMGSLNTHAEKHSDWRDSFREGLGVINLAPKVENIDWASRKINADGTVKVNASDAVYGVSQPELQQAYETWRRGELNNSTAGDQYESLFSKPAVGGNGLWTPTRINETDVQQLVNTENTRITEVKEAMSLLSNLEVNAEGAGKKQALIQQLRSNPKVSAQEVNQAYTSLLQFNPETITDRAQATANLDNTRQSTQSLKNADELALRTEVNNHAIQVAEIDYKNDVNEYNWKNAEADRDYKWRAAEADREQKKLLTMLGYEDKRDSRAADREDRRAENRQLMIMQLMKGLGNLGQSMAL